MDELPIPLSRTDLYLAKAAGMAGVTLPDEPLSREEQFLAVIAGDTSVELPAAANLTEIWLAFVAGVEPSPLPALEGAFWVGQQKVDVRYFAVAAGMVGVEAPAPQNRTEQYWARIAEVMPVHGVLKYATGTNIYLTDVVRGIDELQFVYGDTAQQAYTGKNLFDKNNVQGGYYHINGNQHKLISEAGTYSCYVPIEAGATYTVSKMATSRFTIATTQEVPAPDVATENEHVGGSSTSLTLTAGAGAKYLVVYFYRAASDTATIEEIEATIQIEKGSSPTAYEPYVGGVPAPNPEYPQDVNVVAGEQTVEIVGKNLFYESHDDFGINSTDGSIVKIQGRYAYVAKVQAGQTYTTSCSAIGSSTYFFYGFYASEPTYQSECITFGQIPFSSLSSTITAPAGAKYCVIFYGAAFRPDCQFERGLTPTAYEPYQSQSYEVNLGKNLFDISKVITASTGKLVNNGDGTLTVTGYGQSAGAPSRLSSYCPDLKAGDVVTLSANTTSTNKFIYLSGTNTTWSFGSTRTILESDLSSSVLWYAYPSGDNTPAIVSDIQIEMGSTATEYVPYIEPIELCKIGDYQDYIYKSGSDWYVHKAIGKAVLTGSEDWQLAGSSTNTSRFSVSASGLGLMSAVNGYCNSNVYVTKGVSSDTQLCGIVSGTLYYRVNHGVVGDIDSLTQFKTWVASNNIIVYTALATPTDTKITDATLIAELNAIDSATLPKPDANITLTATSPNLPASIKISYYGEEE